MAIYGGDLMINLGAFCYVPLGANAAGRPQMGFDRRDPNANNRGFPDSRSLLPRLEMYCILRCSCDRGQRVDTLTLPTQTFHNAVPWRLGVAITIDEGSREARAGYRQKDFNNDPLVWIEPLSHTESLARLDEYKTDVFYPSKEEQTRGLTSKYIGMKKPNWIKCDERSPEPPFQLFSQLLPWSRFRTFQDLCAAALSGGYWARNAGGVCKNYQGRPTPQFLNEFVPDPSWSSSTNWRAAWTIRAWCWTKCSCLTELAVNQTPGQMGPIPYFDDASVEIVDGKVSVIQQTRYSNWNGDSTVRRRVQLTPDPSTPEGRRTCNETAGDYCGANWPTDILGPMPESPEALAAEATEDETGLALQMPASSTQLHGQCGSRCESNADCTGSEQDRGCVCKARPRSVGLVMMSFVAAFCWRLPVSSRKGLAGRTIGDGVGCVCNTTYISRACCHAPDGLVWEERGFKLGILELGL
ncbi:MAG: hypothetical protein M1814_006767 [Vezdaea aestivalis]|nr:MAG: hypothetical protein M1814_006767 [Vezdaea aestivalis]